MASSKLTRQEADKLVKARKITSASVSWKSFGKDTWRLEAKALIQQTKEIVVIKGYIGHDNYGFVLLYNNTPIRKYTKHQRHIWKGQIFTQPHKHIWDEEADDKEVYIPNDIDPNADISNQFLAFCRECNIEIKGGYQTFLMEVKRK